MLCTENRLLNEPVHLFYKFWVSGWAIANHQDSSCHLKFLTFAFFRDTDAYYSYFCLSSVELLTFMPFAFALLHWCLFVSVSCTSIKQGGATHVDIACDPELVKLATSLTSLPVNPLIETSVSVINALIYLVLFRIRCLPVILDMSSYGPANTIHWAVDNTHIMAIKISTHPQCTLHVMHNLRAVVGIFQILIGKKTLSKVLVIALKSNPFAIFFIEHHWVNSFVLLCLFLSLSSHYINFIKLTRV